MAVVLVVAHAEYVTLAERFGRPLPHALMLVAALSAAVYTAAQLRAYRSGERKTSPNQMMPNIAALLSDEEIDAVASYVQGLR